MYSRSTGSPSPNSVSPAAKLFVLAVAASCEYRLGVRIRHEIEFQRAQHVHAVQISLRGLFRSQQLLDHAARGFEQDAIGAGDGGCLGRTARNQAQRAEYLARAENHGRRTRNIQIDFALEDVENGISIFAPDKDFVSRFRHAHRARDHEFPQRQGRNAPEQPHALADQCKGLVHVVSERRRAQLGLKNRMIGGFELVPEQTLHHIVALVHRLFDQRIPGQGADDVEAGHGGFEFGRERGQRIRRRRDEPHADGFQKSARRYCPEPQYDSMAADGNLAVGRLQDQAAARRCRRIIGFDSKHAAVKMTANLAGAESRRRCARSWNASPS